VKSAKDPSYRPYSVDMAAFFSQTLDKLLDLKTYSSATFLVVESGRWWRRVVGEDHHKVVVWCMHQVRTKDDCESLGSHLIMFLVVSNPCVIVFSQNQMQITPEQTVEMLRHPPQ
jgi:hypothetical protein